MNANAYSVHRFRRAIWQFTGGRIAQAVARAILVLALVRILTVADYGAYMLIIGTAELLLPVGSMGITPLTQRYLPQLMTTLSLRKIYGFVGFLAIAQLVVLGIIAAILGKFWTTLAPVFGMSPAQIAGTSMAAWLFLIIPAFRYSAEVMEAMLAQGQIARAIMVFVRVAAIGVLIVVKPTITLTDVLLVDMISTAVCLVISWVSIQQTIKTLHTPGANGTLPIREMGRFVWHMALVGPMSAAVSPGTIRLVLANSIGVAESGLYAFLQSLERVVSRVLPATLLRNLIRPILISRTVGGGSTELLKAGTGLLLKSNMLTVFGGLVIIAVCGDQLVLVMSGGKFAGAGVTLLLLYVNMIATSQRGIQEMVMQITGHTQALWITATVPVAALVVVWLMAGYGINVAVLVVCAGSIISNWIAAGVLHRKTDWFRVDWRGMFAIFLPGVAAAILGIGLKYWLPPFIAAGVTLVLFVLFLRVGRPFEMQEIGTMERVIGKKAVGALKGFAI